MAARPLIKNLVEFKRALGDLLTDELYADIERDQQERATMSMLIPPQMVNTMDESDLSADPVRRYMAPALSDREREFPSHPMASRDSLHEADMWAVEGLTHRYPTKVLAELIPTCPQYCGHCTRMDLVGNDTSQVLKYKFEMKQNERWDAMLDYLEDAVGARRRGLGRRHGERADQAAAGVAVRAARHRARPRRPDRDEGPDGDPPALPAGRRARGLRGDRERAHEREVEVAIHTHVNAAQQVTPLVGAAVRKLLDMGYRDVRNQGVLLRGVNTTTNQILELCFALLDHAKIMPYYFYMCDMIPNSEHWRLAVWEAQELQFSVMGISSRVRDAEVRLRRAVRRQALGAHDERLRPREGHHVLEEELPDRDRVRRRRGARTRAPVLRPDLHAPRRGTGVLARVHGQGPGPRAPARLTAAQSPGFPIVRRWGHDARKCENDVP